MDINNIAITGISGRFANCASVEEFKQSLFNGTDLITDNHQRWSHQALKTPKSMGIVNDFEKFDASFFEINPKTSELLDPRARKLLEVVFESIVDSGINPNDLRGSNTGVFLGIMQNSLDYNYLNPSSGINSTTYITANNISYTFDFHGPSCGVDAGCSSSIYAMNQAVDSIRLGVCDAAVVCSAHANFLPYDSMEFTKLGVLSPDGRCKTFDDDRNGYVKSEAVVAIFLQKRETARRIYATVSGIGCNVDGYKEDGLTHPSSRMQISLLRDIYQRYAINSDEVTYVECHGTGTLVGDIRECEALDEFFFSTKRTTPLRIGSVKTNVGHTEAAGGLVSLVKLLIVIQTEVIPANLHFESPAVDIPAVFNGKLEVVSQNTKYTGGLLALNSFGLGGANGHLVISPYSKLRRNNDDIKARSYIRLIRVSGRTNEAVEYILNKVNENREDADFLSLVDSTFSTEIKNHGYRGYINLDSSKRYISRCPSRNRPIWFSYSGMGSQWPKMGNDLVKFEVFRDTLKKCATALKPYDLDLENLVVNGTAEMFEDPVNCFTSIIALSVGLTDLLYSLEIKPDGIFGHSLGEIGCAYGDGVITAEQAVLIAYARGWATKNTKLIPGLMASVGLSLEECQALLPDDIFVACHNSIDNVTISGPEESITRFAEKLLNRGIFLRIVKTANIAFHSKYINDVGPKFLEFVKKINVEQRLRKLWLPSAVPEDQWDSDLGKYHSAEYQCHNFLNQVLYSQILKKIPKDAIIIEVAPDGLFQAILRRALEPSITKLHLVQKHCEDIYNFFLDGVGRLYVEGCHPNFCLLNEKQKIPVGPRATMLSPLIKWNHSVKWPTPKYDPNRYFGKKVEINMASRANSFLLSHIVNGRILFPASGYVTLAWKTFAESLGRDFESLPVAIEKLKLIKSSVLSKNDSIIFTISIMKSGEFEISDQTDVVASGRIRVFKVIKHEFSNNPNCIPTKLCTDLKLNADDIYTDFYIRGSQYGNNFRSIKEIDYNCKTAMVKWSKNWITFLDSIFQSMALFENSTLAIPEQVSNIVINPAVFKVKVKQLSLNYSNFQKCIYRDGVKVNNVRWSKVPIKRRAENISRRRHEFVASISRDCSKFDTPEDLLDIMVQIVTENSFSDTVNILEINDETNTIDHKSLIEMWVQTTGSKATKYKTVKSDVLMNENGDFIIVSSVKNNMAVLNYFDGVPEGTFFYSEDSILSKKIVHQNDFSVVFQRQLSSGTYTLFRKLTKFKYNCPTINISGINRWTQEVKEVLENDSKIILVAKFQEANYLGFYQCIDEQSLRRRLRIFYIKDENWGEYDLESAFFRKQLEKDLAINVLQNNEWGTYRYLSTKERLIKVESCFVSVKNNKFELIQQNPYQFKHNRVDVHYGSIDYWDQTNNTSKERCFGMEYSGVTDSGIKIMGITAECSLRTHLSFHDNLTWTVPRKWTLKEAVTVPVAYTISYYGLFVKGNLKPYHAVLLCYNATSIDYAAITLILNTKPKFLIATASQKDAKFLTNYFPKLKNNIVDPSSSYYQETIWKWTQGKGLDIIFNSNSDQLVILKSTIELLRHEGKIIDISFADNGLASDLLELVSNQRCILYQLSLDSLLKENHYVLKNIKYAIQSQINKGAIQPFYSDSIGVSNIDRLSKYLDNGNITNKITIAMKENDISIIKKYADQYFALPKTYLDPQKSYILFAKFNALDSEIIRWLYDRGVRKFVVIIPMETISGYAAYVIDQLRKKGATIVISFVDTVCCTKVQEIVDQALELGRIGGVFYLVPDVNDVSTEPSYQEFLETDPRHQSIKNIYDVCRNACRSLDYFVVFSSAYSESSRYTSTYTTTAIENLCGNQMKDNLAVIVVQWGPIECVNVGGKLGNSKIGTEAIPQSIYSCLESLDIFMQKESGIYSSVAFNSIDDGKDTSIDTVSEAVAKIFSIKDLDQIDPSVSLVNLGMDSIMGFEIKSLLRRQFGLDLKVTEIRKLTLEDIQSMEERKKIKL